MQIVRVCHMQIIHCLTKIQMYLGDLYVWLGKKDELGDSQVLEPWTC